MQSSSEPLVSIGIASYNNACYIEQMLESVRNQTYSPIELVVVDDCSTDNSVSVIQTWMARTNYPVQLVQHTANQGIVRTFSDCRANAQGEYISLVGSDDVLAPDMISATIAEFERQGAACGAVYSDCRIIDSEGKQVAESFLQFFDKSFAENPPSGNIIVPLLSGFYLPALTATVRRTAMDKAGPYDATLYSEDLDMWIRISRNFTFSYINKNLGAYRVHNASAMHTNRLALNETYFRIYKKGYFQGEAEWAAARHHLADQAEHYYASNGPDASAKLWYALTETKNPKLSVFWILAKLGFSYATVRRLMPSK